MTFDEETKALQERSSGPPDRSLYRNFYGEWKHRDKPHLQRLPMHGMWLCKAKVGPDSFNTIGGTPLQACADMLRAQQDWWDDITRGRELP